MAAQGASQRAIARAVGKNPSSVAEFLNPYCNLAKQARQRRRYRENPKVRAKRLGKAVEDLKPLQEPRIIRKGYLKIQPKTQHKEPTLPWHYDAIRHQLAGLGYKEIGALVGRSPTNVRRFLDVDAYEKWRKLTNARLRRKYAADDEYRERQKGHVRASIARRQAAAQQAGLGAHP